LANGDPGVTLTGLYKRFVWLLRAEPAEDEFLTTESGAGAALSSRVVLVDAQACAHDVCQQIELYRATHAVVFEAGPIGGRTLGLVRLDETVRQFQQRLFSEFLQPGAKVVIASDLALEEIVRCFGERDVDAAIVVDEQERFVGVVTSQSLLAVLAEQRNGVARQQQQLFDRYERLSHIGRINTMGEMASGLAHELNQPLTAIVAYVDACQELVESGRMTNQQLVEVLRSVSSQAERAGQIIHRLRKMVKRSQPDSSVSSINEAIREVALLQASVANQSGITIELDLDEDLPGIPIDFLQIQQVLLHLMDNGCDAMHDSPRELRRLTVSTCRLSEFEIEIAVCDQGCGVTDDAAGRLFESFFSTKTDGMGLGLSVSRTIVKAHGGRIWIAPNFSRGVTARFTLPINDGKAAHGRESHRIHC
jgi:C4-dicarboxylate-specific signal transduction histidine kinase